MSERRYTLIEVRMRRREVTRNGVFQLAAKFSGPLHGGTCVRVERCTRDVEDPTPSTWWLVVRFDDATDTDDASSSAATTTAKWKLMRTKWEAVCVLMVISRLPGYDVASFPAFWDCVLQSLGGWSRGLSSDLSTATPLQLMIDLSYMDIQPQHVSLMRRMLLGMRAQMRISYVHAMEQLRNRAATHAITKPSRVAVGLRLSRAHVTSVVFRRIKDMVRELADMADAVMQGHGALYDSLLLPYVVVDIVHVDISSQSVTGDHLMALREMVASPAVRLREIVLDKLFDETSSRAYMAAFGALMSAIFHVSDRQNAQTWATERIARLPTWSLIERLSMDWNALSFLHLTALFAALHHARAVHELSLVGAFHRFEGRHKEPWMWLAYGVFHTQSSARVYTLNLSKNRLRSSYVVAMRRVLQQHTGLGELLGASSHSTTNHAVPTGHVARVRQDARLFAEPSMQSAVRMSLNDEKVFEVARHQRKWVCLLIPGYGTLWAKRSSVISVTDQQPGVKSAMQRGLGESSERAHDQIARCHRVRTLLLCDMDIPDSSALRELLDTAAIGSFLSQLDVSCNQLTNADIGAFLRACPQLTKLVARDCELTSISALIDAYRNGNCNLAVIDLGSNHIGRYDIVNLCSVLRDSTKRAGRLLRELHLDDNPITKRGLEAIQRVFEADSRIALELLVLDRAEDPEGSLRDRLEAYQGEHLGVASAPDETKYALVSVISTFPECQRFDPALLGHLLSFAGTPRWRQIIWKGVT